MITIIDYGIGNAGSILNMLKKLGISSQISADFKDIQKSTGLILPGVGSFDTGMSNLKQANLISVIEKKVLEEKTPILGICLGAQLLTKCSEEGKLPGLGWLDVNTIKFNFSHINEGSLKVPHMGWNYIKANQSHPILDELVDDNRFYFVHSYHFVCSCDETHIGTTRYGYDFPSIIGKNCIIGTQFHPEKSHKFGMKVLENFAKMTKNYANT